LDDPREGRVNGGLKHRFQTKKALAVSSKLLAPNGYLREAGSSKKKQGVNLSCFHTMLEKRNSGSVIQAGAGKKAGAPTPSINAKKGKKKKRKRLSRNQYAGPAKKREGLEDRGGRGVPTREKGKQKKP